MELQINNEKRQLNKIDFNELSNMKKTNIHNISDKRLDNKIISVKEDEYIIVDNKQKSYIVATSGCAAIKLFISSGHTNQELVFHSFGTENSLNSARDITNYINSLSDVKAVDVLHIQPYINSVSSNKVVNELINNLDKEKGISVTRTLYILDNIGGEDFSKFIKIDLKGNKNDILERYKNFTHPKTDLSLEERQEKIKLFYKIPQKVKTQEFIKQWGRLNLYEAKKMFEKIEDSNKKSSIALVNLIYSIATKIYNYKDI